MKRHNLWLEIQTGADKQVRAAAGEIAAKPHRRPEGAGALIALRREKATHDMGRWNDAGGRMATESRAGQIHSLVVGEPSDGRAKHLFKDEIGAMVRMELGAKIGQSASCRHQDPIPWLK